MYLSKSGRKVRLDGRVVPRPKLEAQVGQLLERVGLHQREHGGAAGGQSLQPSQERRPCAATITASLCCLVPSPVCSVSCTVVVSPAACRSGILASVGVAAATTALEKLDELPRERLEVHAQALVVLQLVVVILAHLVWLKMWWTLQRGDNNVVEVSMVG